MNVTTRLEQQPPGHVILMAHSMGGLLAAEAVTDSSAMSKRIIGLVNFDVPFLGMHPHVIITGIASLLPKEKEKLESEVNDHSLVKIERDEDAEASSIRGMWSKSLMKLKLRIVDFPSAASPTSTDDTRLYSSAASLSGSQLDLAWEAEKASFTRKSAFSVWICLMTPSRLQLRLKQ